MTGLPITLTMDPPVPLGVMVCGHWGYADGESFAAWHRAGTPCRDPLWYVNERRIRRSAMHAAYRRKTHRRARKQDGRASRRG